MKTILLVLALMGFSGCMAEWTDVQTQPAIQRTIDTSSGQGQDVSGPGADAKAVPVACNTPAKDRLVNLGDGTWHDNLLDLDCQFMKTVKGKKCLPGTPGDSVAMNDWPMPATTVSPFFQSSDCTSNRLWFCHQDNKGRIPRFGIVNDGTGSVPMVFNLRSPSPDTVVALDPVTGEASSLTGVYWSTKSASQVGECKPYSGETVVPPKPFNRIENGIASIPQCPFMTGLDLFADMPQ